MEFLTNIDPVWYDLGYRVVQDALIIAGVAAVLVIISRYID